jgi:hypothetical protein
MLEPTLVSISRGATQAFILIKADNPVASVILFAGGAGGTGPGQRVDGRGIS